MFLNSKLVECDGEHYVCVLRETGTAGAPVRDVHYRMIFDPAVDDQEAWSGGAFIGEFTESNLIAFIERGRVVTHRGVEYKVEEFLNGFQVLLGDDVFASTAWNGSVDDDAIIDLIDGKIAAIAGSRNS